MWQQLLIVCCVGKEATVTVVNTQQPNDFLWNTSTQKDKKVLNKRDVDEVD